MATGSISEAVAGASRTDFLPAHDVHGKEIDLTPIRPLLDRIVATWKAERIWLFGSRARGEAQQWSDWDVFAVVPDDVPEEQFGASATWRLRKQARVRADILACHSSEFREDRDTPNTMAYAVAREGVLVYER